MTILRGCSRSSVCSVYLSLSPTLNIVSIVNGGVANVTLPKNIAPGNYIIRHEIIALHLANSKGGAEFYPSCSQLTIGGSGTDAPSDDELVSLPGAYSDLDPGIFVPNVSSILISHSIEPSCSSSSNSQVFDPDNVYIFPGPLVASMAASTASKAFGASANTTVTSTGGTTTGSSSGSSGGSGSSSGNGTAGTSSPQSTGGGAGKTCRLKSGSSASANARRALRARPHTLSRIMRHLTPSLS